MSKFAAIVAELDAATNCKSCELLAHPDRFGCDEEDAAFIDGLMRDSNRPTSHISKILGAGGVSIGDSSIRRHREKHQGQ